MTKTDEIHHLDLMIATYGPDSYIGPWLTEWRDRIVADITSDHYPGVPMPGEATRQAQQILTDARREADIITRRAGEQATKTRDEARRDARAIREQARHQLETIARGL